MARKGKARISNRDKFPFPGLSDEDVVVVRQTLDDGGCLPTNLLLRALGATQPCPGPKSSECKASNPNCLCKLIPAEGRSRQKGLWAKDAVAVAELGPDPTLSLRTDLSKPVGLVNLGSTCYINTVLQTLYAITPFRTAVYAAEPPVADDPVVLQLRQLFAGMEWGRRDPLDPSSLVAALQLDHAVQQDGQEFMKLFLGLLESRFQAQPALSGVPRDLFRGESGYETRCLECGRLSASSGRREGYYELAVPLVGHGSLGVALASLVAPEGLSGSNAVACDTCGRNTAAERVLRLAAWPPLLCLSLQRFVFDYKKLDRVKINDPMLCPLRLDIASLGMADTGEAGQPPGPSYRLAAIMLHKGSAARAGHYVAHVNYAALSTDAPLADSIDAWWRFDDVAVTPLAAGPSSAPADHGSALALKAATARLGPEATQESILSCTAYQLLYRREGIALPPVPLSAAGEAWVVHSKEEAAGEDDASARAYIQTRDEMLARRTDRQRAVKCMLDRATDISPSDPGCFVSTSWLQRLCDAEPGAAVPVAEEGATTALLCSHGALDPTLASTDARRISGDGWELLCELAGPSRRLQPADVCPRCLSDRLQGAAALMDVSVRRESLVKQAADLLRPASAQEGNERGTREDGSGEEPSGVYVSRAWLSGWIARNGHFPSKRTVALPGPGTGILCPHGLLVPENTGRKQRRRIAVPLALWRALEKDWHQSEPLVAKEEASSPAEDTYGPPAVGTMRDCPECQNAEASAAAVAQAAASERQPEKAALAMLAAPPPPLQEVVPLESVALVPTAFMNDWRAWVKGSSDTAPSLADAMLACLCPAPDGPASRVDLASAEEADLAVGWRLVVEPPEPIPRRGKWFVAGAAKDHAPDLEVLSLENWHRLAAFQDLPPRLQGGLRATLCKREVGPAGDVGTPVQAVEWETIPATSAEGIRERRSAREAALLTYDAGEVVVHVVPAEEGPRDDAPEGLPAARASKRARRGMVVLTLASSTTLQDLRGHVYQQLGVHPGNACFYVGAQSLEGPPDSSLAQHQIFPGTRIKVVDSGVHAADDLAGLVPSGATTKREEGAGFGGTLLASG